MKRRNLAMWVVAAVFVAGGANLMAADLTDDEAVRPRAVRGEWTMAETLIAEGTARSASLRALVAELDRSDVLVYVDVGFDVSSAAGRTTLAGSSGSTRVLRVFVNARLDATRRVEILGHELMHCVEIGRSPSVHDRKSLAELERSIGWRAGSVEEFETAAARAMELRIHAELAAR